jgi:hypothetical protein
MMEQKISKNNLKEYATDNDDKAVNGALKGFMQRNEQQYNAGKISKDIYLKKKAQLERALASK